MRSRLSDWMTLSKPRITLMQVITVSMGYVAAQSPTASWLGWAWTVFGTLLVAAGASALNQVYEKGPDSQMKRTAMRPIAANRISEEKGLLFGVALVVMGVAVHLVFVNVLTAFFSILTAFLYVMVYTPSKRMSWINTWIGAVPGALPPVGGWAAASGHLGWGALALFLLLFFWQMPHFYAIAWMFKAEYEGAGFKMLPAVDKTGFWTRVQVVVFLALLALIPMSMYQGNLVGLSFAVGGTAVGGYFVWASLPMLRDIRYESAKSVLRASVIYLPVILILFLVDLGLR